MLYLFHVYRHKSAFFSLLFFTCTSFSGVSDKCTCEKHGSAHFTVHKCPCMLSADELSEYNRHVEMAIDHMQNGDNLEALLAYIKALEIADYDLEMRQKVCSLVLE